MQVYVIARNEDSTGQNVTFHSGLRSEEDDYVILRKSKGTWHVCSEEDDYVILRKSKGTW
jgi:hypothetical protein